MITYEYELQMYVLQINLYIYIHMYICKYIYICACVFRLLLASNRFFLAIYPNLCVTVAAEDGFHRAAWPTQTTERTIDTSVTIVHKAGNPYEPPRKTQHISFYGLVERDIYNGSL